MIEQVASFGTRRSSGRYGGSKVVKELEAIKQSLQVNRAKSTIPWIKTGRANTIFGIVIIINAIFIGVDIELWTESFMWGPWVIESLFLLLFCLELLLRVRAEYPHIRRFFDAWGVFDSVITLLGCLDAWVITPILGSDADNPMSSLTVLRILRLSRLVRLVRVLRMFSELVLVVRSIGASMAAVTWMSVLLLITMYIGSIVTVMLLGDLHRADDPEVDKYFGSLFKSFFSHFCVVTLEDWPVITRTAMKHSYLWAFYFVGLVIFSNFALVNLMIGIIVNRVVLLHKEQEIELTSFAAESNMFRSTLQTLFDSVDLDFSDEVSLQDIRNLLKRPQTAEILSAFGINLNIPAATLYTIMDLNREGSTTFQEFFDGCIRLSGSQSHVHTLYVQHDICKSRQELGSRMTRIEELLRPPGPDAKERRSTPPTSPRATEASLLELLDRMDGLRRVQQEMLSDLRGLRREARPGHGGPQPGKGQGAPGSSGRGPGVRPDSSRGGVHHTGLPPADDQGSSTSQRPLDYPGASCWGYGLPELLQRRGQDLAACCSMDPLGTDPGKSSAQRSRSAEPGLQPSLWTSQRWERAPARRASRTA